MLDTLFIIDDFLPFLYITICLVSVAHFQMTTSLSHVAVIISISDLLHSSIRDTVWDNLPLLDPDVARIVWTGLWCSANLVTAWVIFKVHIWRNIAISRAAYVAITTLGTFNIVHTIRYLSAITVKSEFIAFIYQFTIPFINIALAIYLLSALFRDIYDIRIKARVRRLPR